MEVEKSGKLSHIRYNSTSNNSTRMSRFCRICATTNHVECSIYESLSEGEGKTSLHMMLGMKSKAEECVE
ncbi:uncharacterized protein LOC131259558 isoform X2 [Anopheles coustani]|uniref:uncharacterized protein LOC131259558 isoform X2 n=1 Tax=Anopheles coustani TaxID=139045 RepID=UPI0026599221|nr:uncharacterized protein LOC131259558 isoform X2 [Anopheles coustani]